MNPAKVLVVTVLAGTLSIGIALFGERWIADGQTGADSAQGGEHIRSLPDIRLPDPDGREIASNSWAGKVVVVNFWATWCPPCLREMPMLVRLQEAFDTGRLQVVGIAIDSPDAVHRFLDEREINYQILLGNAQTVALSKRLGNRTSGLPFTVVFDRMGRRVFSRTGEISAEELKAAVLPLVQGNSG
ncbi:MAG: TlpA family protein disulfide reductase [Thiohalocapsa sp.]|jgi:thiol-disulfide isomerase/thioredoxin|nr:TlpA family protein disulfide reductase [Thiohalocapsa sp.]MCF7991145.1 TlpA family protein disulfide reductase [Thiohalocapsa sp.]